MVKSACPHRLGGGPGSFIGPHSLIATESVVPRQSDPTEVAAEHDTEPNVNKVPQAVNFYSNLYRLQTFQPKSLKQKK